MGPSILKFWVQESRQSFYWKTFNISIEQSVAVTFSDLCRKFFCWAENHLSTSTLLTFSVIVYKRPRPCDFNLWFEVRLGVWYWKWDLLQVTWAPKDSGLPCSICYCISVFFPPDSTIHHHMRFNVFTQTLFAESCLCLLYTVYFWPLGFPSSLL